MKNKDYFLIAHIEPKKTFFLIEGELKFEFKKEVDAWAKIEASLRHQIRNPGKKRQRMRPDLTTTTYSFHQKID